MHIKTLALIAITSADRVQTIHLMNIKRVHISETSIKNYQLCPKT